MSLEKDSEQKKKKEYEKLDEELGKRKGWSLEQSTQIHKQMEQRTKESGLQYNFDKTVPANSFKAHRLLHLAKKHDVQNQVKEEMKPKNSSDADGAFCSPSGNC